MFVYGNYGPTLPIKPVILGSKIETFDSLLGTTNHVDTPNQFCICDPPTFASDSVSIEHVNQTVSPVGVVLLFQASHVCVCIVKVCVAVCGWIFFLNFVQDTEVFLVSDFFNFVVKTESTKTKDNRQIIALAPYAQLQ